MESFEKIYKNLLKLGKYVEELQNLSFNDIGDKLNKTERKLLTVVCTARMDNRRVISTQIAEALGITRSAVSQMVDKLEKEGYIKRVASQTDKKIAYIELMPLFWERYEEGVRKSYASLDCIVERMGEENIAKMFSLADEFMLYVNSEKEKVRVKKK